LDEKKGSWDELKTYQNMDWFNNPVRYNLSFTLFSQDKLFVLVEPCGLSPVVVFI
jgi:hypothetical protein